METEISSVNVSAFRNLAHYFKYVPLWGYWMITLGNPAGYIAEGAPDNGQMIKELEDSGMDEAADMLTEIIKDKIAVSK